MRSTHHPQRDLFQEDRKLPDMAAPQRSLVVSLIAGLLVEANGGSEASATITETTEADHEQDHA